MIGFHLRRRVRYLAQMEMSECGAACLGMILDFFGAAIPLAAVRQACGVSRDGCTALQLVQAARGYGLTTRALRVEARALLRQPLPAILHWRMNHFVVLERLRDREAVIVDPASGRRRIPWSELDEAFTGVVLLFQPGPAFRRQRRQAASLSRYFAVLRRSGGSVVQACLLLMMMEVLEITLPAANQVLIDQVIRPAREYWLWVLVLAYAGASLASTLVRALRDRVLMLITHALDLTLVSHFVEHLLQLPAQFIEQRTSGDLMQRVEANSNLRDLSLAIIRAVMDGLLVVTLSILALAYDPVLGSTLVVANALRLLLVALLNRRVNELTASELSLAGSERSAAVEGLSLPELVRAFRAENLLCQRFAERLIKRRNASLEIQRRASAVSASLSLFDTMLSALVLCLGGQKVIGGSMTLGVFVAFMTLRGLLFASVQGLAAACTSFLYARGIIFRLDDVLESEPTPRGSRDPGSITGALALRGLTYRHAPAAEPVLRELDLSVRPGEKIAIVGRSGAGKTTLARLMLGLLAPTDGAVLIDGVDMRELDRARLMRQIGAVLQESFFFDASVRENLSFGLDTVSDSALSRALRLACMEETIAALPAGWDTRMGANGARFSRGQRQRLSLARALLADPRILILDEATSSLDLETEALLHRNLSQLACTRIVIAHRLATVEDADRILVLQAGRIDAQGSYRELSAQPGLFQEMLSHVH